MMWRDIGYICEEKEHFDKFGKPNKSFKEREVFLNKKGVKRNEFYQAASQGFRPELCVEIRQADYNKESHLKFDDTLYRIIRSYPVENECLELICQAFVE